MRKRDIISGIIFIIIALLFCGGAARYGIGNFSNPQSGLYPLLLGLILIILSLVHLFSSLKKKDDGIKIRFFPPWEKTSKLILALVFLYAYGMTIEFLGYVLTTSFFMIGVLRFVALQKWRTVLTTSFLAVLLSYLVFVTLLKTQLPRGILGI